MSRLLFDSMRRQGRGGESAADNEELSRGRSVIALQDEGAASRSRRAREDRCGRRSLTGLEFRRRRSR